LSCPGAARRDASVSRSDDAAHRTFPRASRLRARTLYLGVYDRGQRVHSTYFVLFGLRGATEISRLGITATKKFGHAVARNRIKRVVREIFRNHRADLTTPIDVVVNVRSNAKDQPYARLEADLVPRLCELCRRLGA
jgi:ribonuclease P protein component